MFSPMSLLPCVGLTRRKAEVKDCAATGTGEPVRAKVTSGGAVKARTSTTSTSPGARTATSSAVPCPSAPRETGARRTMDAHDIAKYWITGKRNEVCCQTCRTRRVSEPRVPN